MNVARYQPYILGHELMNGSAVTIFWVLRFQALCLSTDISYSGSADSTGLVYMISFAKEYPLGYLYKRTLDEQILLEMMQHLC